MFGRAQVCGEGGVGEEGEGVRGWGELEGVGVRCMWCVVPVSGAGQRDLLLLLLLNKCCRFRNPAVCPLIP